MDSGPYLVEASVDAHASFTVGNESLAWAKDHFELRSELMLERDHGDPMLTF